MAQCTKFGFFDTNCYCCTTAQWCVFNNYSLDKYRHQIWHHFVISVLKVEITNWTWISPQIVKKIHKLGLDFFWWFSSCNFFFKSAFFYKKNHFSYLIKTNIPNACFKSYIFTFLTFFNFKSFVVVLKIQFCFPKTCWIFLSNHEHFNNHQSLNYWSQWLQWEVKL